MGNAANSAAYCRRTAASTRSSRLARTPLLRNPYRLAVQSVFEAIRDTEHARVLDVGVGAARR